jgi:Tfp pilus assembly PilM family ATPase
VRNALGAGKFKSRRAVMAIPSTRTFIQHMQITKSVGTTTEALLKAQLYSQMGCLPESVVVRSVEVSEVHRGGQAQSETICFAIARDTIMRYLELLKRCKLNVVGVHTEALAMVRAFDHLNRRDGDEDLTTLYVDLGWSGTDVTIAHGREIVFARHIQVGGCHFDQHIGSTLHCDLATARGHRLAISAPPPPTPSPSGRRSTGRGGTALLEAAAQAHTSAQRTKQHEGDDDDEGGVATQQERRSHDGTMATCQRVPTGGDPPHRAGKVDLTELLDTITDELSMCLRYHHGLFPTRSIDRSIFVGGEARQMWLCQHAVKGLRLPAQLGDPVSRLAHDKSTTTAGVDFDQPQPGWAVAYGLCMAPTDL